MKATGRRPLQLDLNGPVGTRAISVSLGVKSHKLKIPLWSVLCGWSMLDVKCEEFAKTVVLVFVPPSGGKTIFNFIL
ncbi:hypothetical protein JTE90_028142 [Oedothorax gibbosus]|uniref:Uncharacterized protein n=1 Tax=Oedothorax gibbosus TaxID=931172 RepID=A0AAV6V8T3_9ARAC|nr:hypothetical protein JTE90_028142 [Oedothorax gibbosus]